MIGSSCPALDGNLRVPAGGASFFRIRNAEVFAFEPIDSLGVRDVWCQALLLGSGDWSVGLGGTCNVRVVSCVLVYRGSWQRLFFVPASRIHSIS